MDNITDEEQDYMNSAELEKSAIPKGSVLLEDNLRNFDAIVPVPSAS